MNQPITKILIANRGEIACRIHRTCARLGIASATIHSEADRTALHVREIGESIEVGGAAATASYLNIPAIVEAAERVGATAVHPGIGFLSENADFAAAVEAAGLTFIGPRAETMRRFADKWDAKREAMEAGIPVIGGSDGSFADVDDVEKAVGALRLPVLLKAAAGGGGRGVRVVSSYAGLRNNIESAMREAQSSFGRPDILVEQFIDKPRHIEVQIAGDGAGEVIHFYERECSLQRRFQKIIEEAPSSALQPEIRLQIFEAAVRMAERVSYRGLGTMEFLVGGGQFYFLECNPRLQVEHTVTEEITGLDLVEVQIGIAANGKLPLHQDRIRAEGHSIQARIYAEDPCAGFIPSTGQISAVTFPGAPARVDTGVDAGSVVTPFYDAMIAKIITRGSTRAEAINRLKNAIEATSVAGVQTNLTFLSQLLAHAAVLSNRVDNRFIDRELSSLTAEAVPSARVAAIAAKVWLEHNYPRREGDIWSGHGGWRLSDGNDQPARKPAYFLIAGDHRYSIHLGSEPPSLTTLAVDDQIFSFEFRSMADNRCLVAFSDSVVTASYQVRDQQIWLAGSFGRFVFGIEPFLADEARDDQASGKLSAPMIGKIIKVNVAVGDLVKANDTLVVQESMKMELSINAPYDGKVLSVDCSCGDLVERNSVVVTLEQIEMRA
ncbi:acetyl/propionyl/methylcrotonyl-CoA carboxylase subunit alpha [Bradyrhizobium cenepequi]